MIGTTFAGHRILARIGRGGAGTVFLAEDPQGRRVALKLLDAPAHGEGLRRFAAELEHLRRLDHPGIVRALSPLLEDGDRRAFALEFVRGRNLSQLLDELGRLEPDEALRLTADLLDALGAAHAAGVLHRDVKSANILIDDAGRVRVCDFGLARAVDQTRLTLSGQLLGTPAYASPEQARGQASRVESDLYGAGVVLYEALTGTLPFRAETPLAVLRLHLDEAPDPPSVRRPGLPPAIDALVLRALAKRPEERFPTAAAMREAVLAAREGLTAAPGAVLEAVRRQVEAEPLAPPARRRPRLPAAALLLAAPLLLLAGYGARPAAPAPVAPAPVATGPPAPVATALAPVASAASPGRAVTVRRAGGATHRGRLVAIEGGRVRLVDEAGRPADIPLDDVASIRYGP